MSQLRKTNFAVTTATLDPILDRALAGADLSEAEGVVLLQQTDPNAIEQIRDTADRLRQRQAGETVTYVINRNINFTNICEQHCSFCAFRRDAGEAGAYWLDEAVMLEKAAEAVRRGATEICMQGGLNPEAKLSGTIAAVLYSGGAIDQNCFSRFASARFFTTGSAVYRSPR
jgi:FO synthase subunit 2